VRCPICKQPVGAREENAAFPFCSERCRLIDLGKWLGEEYRVTPERDTDDPRTPSDDC
jgi:endogenous inhibitor of DNA gyrase (YacG/DUF329 family)